jgi:hypothetical protein
LRRVALHLHEDRNMTSRWLIALTLGAPKPLNEGIAV